MRSGKPNKRGPAVNEDHAALFFPNVDPSQCLGLLRKEVQRLGRIAEIRAKAEQEDIRRARRDIKHLHVTLDRIDRLTRWLPNSPDVASLAADLSRGVDPAGSRSAIPSLVRTIEYVRDLREWGASLRQFKVVQPLPSHSDPLARYFVELIVHMFRFYRKKEPPRGRTGLFADFLAAAWTDLKFPVPKAEHGQPKDLMTWLGQKAEKVPRSTKSISSQKR